MKEMAIKLYIDQTVEDKISRSMGILREYLAGEFKTLQEGQNGFDEKLDRFELETGQRFKFVYERLDAIVIDLGNVVEWVDNHEKRFDNLEKRFDGLENRFDGLESKFEVLLGEIREIKEKIFS